MDSNKKNQNKTKLAANGCNLSVARRSRFIVQVFNVLMCRSVISWQLTLAPLSADAPGKIYCSSIHQMDFYSPFLFGVRFRMGGREGGGSAAFWFSYSAFLWV